MRIIKTLKTYLYRKICAWSKHGKFDVIEVYEEHRIPRYFIQAGKHHMPFPHIEVVAHAKARCRDCGMVVLDKFSRREALKEHEN